MQTFTIEKLFINARKAVQDKYDMSSFWEKSAAEALQNGEPFKAAKHLKTANDYSAQASAIIDAFQAMTGERYYDALDALLD